MKRDRNYDSATNLKFETNLYTWNVRGNIQYNVENIENHEIMSMMMMMMIIFFYWNQLV